MGVCLLVERSWKNDESRRRQIKRGSRCCSNTTKQKWTDDEDGMTSYRNASNESRFEMVLGRRASDFTVVMLLRVFKRATIKSG